MSRLEPEPQALTLFPRGVKNAPERTRTSSLGIRSPTLYPLSYERTRIIVDDRSENVKNIPLCDSVGRDEFNHSLNEGGVIVTERHGAHR